MANGDIIKYKSRYDNLQKAFMEIKGTRFIEYEGILYSMDAVVKIEAA